MFVYYSRDRKQMDKKMTHIIKQTAHTIAGKDLVKTKFSNGVTFIDDLSTITAYLGIDRVALNQEGEKIDGNYNDLNHAQKISEAFQSLIT